MTREPPHPFRRGPCAPARDLQPGAMLPSTPPVSAPRNGAVPEAQVAALCISTETYPLSVRYCDALPRCNRIPMNPQYVQESLAVRTRQEQGSQNRGSRGYERSASPPHVQVVDWRQCRHGPSFSDALFSEHRNRQPAFDEAGVRHRFPRTRQFASPPSFSWSSRRPIPPPPLRPSRSRRRSVGTVGGRPWD